MMHRLHRRNLNESSAHVYPRGWSLYNIIILGVVALLGIVYLLVVNDLSTKVYEVRSLRNYFSSVLEDTGRLKATTIELQSRQELSQAIQAYPFIPEGALEYARSTTVALERHARP